jgi:EAL domain-containing protein (putative c-di-GMP-specific phosphodiesterase class I)
LRDLGSTNGTYVNGSRISGSVVLQADDLVQFANVAFRVRRQAAPNSGQTVQDNACDRALALVQFDKLMAQRAVTPFFQPIVLMSTQEIVSYEVLARSRLFGLETPKEMFGIAAELNLEVELSRMLRWEGVEASRAFAESPHLFVNTHPRELVAPGLIDSLRALRENYPRQRLTLEIHESAVTDGAQMVEIRSALTALNIGLAYDDFGAGQSRLNELVECPPDYLKFDMSLVRDIDSASPQRQQVVATLVQMVHELGISAVAEGVETDAESDTCRQMGFDLGQGFFYGRPAPVRESLR